MTTCLTCIAENNCSTCDSSQNRTYNNATGQCDLMPVTPICSVGCLTCINDTLCLDCDNSTHRILDNGSCVADFGYYTVPNDTNAQLCSALCQTCEGTSTNCTSCFFSSTLINSSCTLCSYLYTNCSTCNDTSCLSCDIGF